MGVVLDFRGKPLDTKPQPLAELGDTGLRIQNGTIWEEYLPQLKGRKAVEAYQEMADSPLCAAFLLLLDLIASRVEWKVKPAKEGDPRSQMEAEWLDGALQDLRVPFTQVVVELLTCVPYGWARSEILYKIRRGPQQDDERLRSDFNDGRFGWLDFEPRSQDSLDWMNGWEWDYETGQLIGMRQWVQMRPNGRDRFFVPESKMIAAVPRPWKRSPEGRSMFRPGYRPWFYGRKLEDIEALGIERDLTGLLCLSLPPDLMDANAPAHKQAVRRDYERKVSKIRRGQMEGLVMVAEEYGAQKTGFGAKLLNSGGQGRINPDTAIRRHEQRLLMSLLFELQEMGMSKVGTQALGATKWNQMQLAMAGLLDAAIVGPFNAKAIPDLYRLNGVPDEFWPSIEYSSINAPSLEEVGDFLSKLAPTGLFVPRAEVEEWLLRKLGAPVKSEAPEVRTVAGAGTQQVEEKDPIEDLIRQRAQTAPASTGAAAQGPSQPQAPEAGPAQDTALNGAQVTAALEIVQAVGAGELPRDAGVNMLREFFNLAADRAERIMGSVGTPSFTPKPAAPAFGAPIAPTQPAPSTPLLPPKE